MSTPTDPQGALESATNTGVSRHSSDFRDNTAPSEDIAAAVVSGLMLYLTWALARWLVAVPS